MKTLIALTLALTFAAASSQAMAASDKCTVTAVNKGSISLDCDNTTESFKIGDEVKIKSVVKTTKKAIEGC